MNDVSSKKYYQSGKVRSMMFGRTRSRRLSGMSIILLSLCFVVDCFAYDPANPPATLRGTVIYNGQIRTFNLDRCSFRGTNFEIILLGTDGITKTTINAGPVRNYRGWCEEEP